jgi:putative oxidoreductase
MKGRFNKRCLLWALRLSVGGVFVYAGGIKVYDPQAFADSIATFRVVPAGLVNVAALTLPPFELLIGGTLLLGWQKRAGALGVIGMTVAFSFALLYARANRFEVMCGCFGGSVAASTTIWNALGRDFVLLLSAIALFWLSKPGCSATCDRLPK